MIKSFSCLLVVCLTLIGCDRGSLELPQGFGNENKKLLLSGLVLHKTSATTYTLTDGDGFGVLDGKVVSLSVEKGEKPNRIFVAYIPFDMQIDDLKTFDLKHAKFVTARIEDLKLSGINAWSEIDPSERKSLERKMQRVDSFKE